MLINKVTTKPGKRDAMTEILLESGKAFETNEDCIMSTVANDSTNENIIWVQDIWKSKQAHEVAMNNESMQAYVERSMDLLEKMPEQTMLNFKGGKV